jgi:hypothetical protein
VNLPRRKGTTSISRAIWLNPSPLSDHPNELRSAVITLRASDSARAAS